MYKLFYTSRFKKDFKVAAKRGYNLSKLEAVVALLQDGAELPERYKDHALTGDWVGHRECHIEPDWLLIYVIDGGELILTLARTGTHSDLF